MEKVFNTKLIINPKLLQWIIVIGVFLNRYLELLIILLVSICIIKITHKTFFKKKILIGLIIIIIHSLLTLTILSYDYHKNLQQFCIISLFIILYYQCFHFFQSKRIINEILPKYLQFVVIVSFLGIIQFIIFLFIQKDIFSMFLFEGISSPQLIQPRIIRIHSILAEPSYLGTMLIPFFVCWIFYPRILPNIGLKSKIIVTAVGIITFSSILYFIVSILLCIKILSFISTKYRILLVLSIFIAILSTNTTLNNDYSLNESGYKSIGMKISQTFKIFQFADDPTIFEGLNLSSYALATNFWVATHAPSRIFGTGLGTHGTNYKILYQSDDPFYGINSEDAYSLFNRIFSEFGIVGCFIYLFTIIRLFNKKSPSNMIAFTVICALLLRGGNYVLYGCIFFHFLLIYTSLKFPQNE